MSYTSPRIDILSSELAQQYLSHGLDHLEVIEGRGEVNQVYKITASNQAAVLRVNDVNEYQRFLKEAWCAQTASLHSIPTPHTIHVGRNDSFAYVLQAYIPGANGQDIDANPRFWHTMGSELQEIHRIHVNGFGEKLEDMTSDTRYKWNDYITNNIQALSSNKPLLESDALTDKEIKKLIKLFERLRAKTFKFGLSHGDYSPANVIVDQSGSLTVIDWGSAEAHIIPHHDFGVILDESLEEGDDLFGSFLQGYGMTKSQYVSIRKDIKTLQILEAVDKLRWAFDKAPNRIQHHTHQLKKFLANQFLGDS